MVPSLCICWRALRVKVKQHWPRIPEESGAYGLNSNCYALRNDVLVYFVAPPPPTVKARERGASLTRRTAAHVTPPPIAAFVSVGIKFINSNNNRKPRCKRDRDPSAPNLLNTNGGYSACLLAKMNSVWRSTTSSSRRSPTPSWPIRTTHHHGRKSSTRMTR